MYGNKKGISQYQQVGLKDQLAVADPHKVTQIMMQLALENLAKAKGCLTNNDLENKGKFLAKSTTILATLKDTLDFEKGGEVAENLARLYDFMLNKIADVVISNNPDEVQDVIDVLLPIKSGWDQISEADKQEAYAQME